MKAIGRLAGFAALATLLLGQFVTQADAALCVTSAGKLSFRDMCRRTERMIAPEELGMVTEGGLPPAFSAWNDGPIYNQGYEVPMVELSIPEAGSYVLVAKTRVTAYSSTTSFVHCRLYGRSSRDEASTSVSAHSEQTIAFNVVDTLQAGDKVRLACADYLGGSSYLSWIKITAIKVGDLTNTRVPIAPGYPVIN